MKSSLKLHRNSKPSSTNLASLQGACINHMWYVNITDVLYNGHVLMISHKSRSKTKIAKLTITYESEEEGIDNTIMVNVS